jgi:hypothetical protein
MTRGVAAPTTRRALGRRDDNSRRTTLCSQHAPALACGGGRLRAAGTSSCIALHNSRSGGVALAALSHWPAACCSRALGQQRVCSCVAEPLPRTARASVERSSVLSSHVLPGRGERPHHSPARGRRRLRATSNSPTAVEFLADARSRRGRMSGWRTASQLVVAPNV